MNMYMSKMPRFVKREMEQIQKIVGPLAKKSSKYALWSLPLISISLVNIVFLLFIVPAEYQSTPTVYIFAALGAFGLALSRESKLQKREIHKLSTDYMIKRIQQSDIASELSQKRYIRLIHEQPLQMMQHFVRFLEEENRSNTIEEN
ncbi:YwnF family protein [Virgibacillus soli]|uniref:YwnF family protein n=1 Tax=Paracerasibacillus soli TaxID=480284 RepID=A0ABU5CTG2_9BACI|nr:YwnF family protein [Virgibacillus soli]MDY0409671.1 YwnF family protein [Virgibacillus soli]